MLTLAKVLLGVSLLLMTWPHFRLQFGIQTIEANTEPRNKTNSFKGVKGIPEPKNRSCYECSDEGMPNVDHARGSCKDFRDLWRKFLRAKKKVGKTDYRHELLYIMKTRFGRNCSYGVEDCFYTRAEDVRIVGYEERGCGSGPEAIDAEPEEGCTLEKIEFGDQKYDVINCVCEDGETIEIGYCNGGWKKGSDIGILGAVVRLFLTHYLLIQIF